MILVRGGTVLLITIRLEATTPTTIITILRSAVDQIIPTLIAATTTTATSRSAVLEFVVVGSATTVTTLRVTPVCVTVSVRQFG